MQKGQVISQGNMHIVIDYGRLPTSFGIEMKHMVFQEAYKPSISAQMAKETEKQEPGKKRSRLHSRQVSPPHLKLPTSSHRHTSKNTDFGDVMYI